MDKLGPIITVPVIIADLWTPDISRFYLGNGAHTSYSFGVALVQRQGYIRFNVRDHTKAIGLSIPASQASVNVMHILKI